MIELNCEQDVLCYLLDTIVPVTEIPESKTRIELALVVDRMDVGLREEAIFIHANTVVSGYIKGSEEVSVQGTPS